MNTIRQKMQQFNEMLKNVRIQGSSLRRRFVAYLLSLLCAVIAAILILLNAFGILDPAESAVEKTLDHQLSAAVSDIEQDCDNMAAYGIILAEQIETIVDEELTKRGLDFEDLNNNYDALTSIQGNAYSLLNTGMKITPCSGAFYLLDATVNDNTAVPSYNALYLKYTNLSSQNTLSNKIVMFRGDSNLAALKDINLSSSWHPEISSEHFEGLDMILNKSKNGNTPYYLLSPVYQLADTWERARFLCVPICDDSENYIGLCGFEISDLYFHLAYKAEDIDQPYMVCALMDESDGNYTAQLSGNKSGYSPDLKEPITIKADSPFSTISGVESLFIAKTEEITIGATSHLVATMIPKNQYNAVAKGDRIKIILTLLFVLAIAALSCLLLSKRYVAPILNGLEHIKSNEKDRPKDSIPEIDDLFDFLAEKDRKHEETLAEHEKALALLADNKKKEIDQDDYELFLISLQTLTPKENEIFRLYLEGKTGTEIMESLNINRNTLKYHNRNIYSKLGVSSRKELLTYAALMKR